MAGMVSRNRPVQVCPQIDTQIAAALQYYQTAMIILELAQAPPQASAGTALQNLGHITSLTRALENRASTICALALSSDSAAVWINSFGPIAFCRLFLLDLDASSTIAYKEDRRLLDSRYKPGRGSDTGSTRVGHSDWLACR